MNTDNSILQDIWNTTKNTFNRGLDAAEKAFETKQILNLRRLEQAGNADRQAKLSAPPVNQSTGFNFNPTYLMAGLGGLALILFLRK